MDILSKARRLEAALTETLDRAAEHVRHRGPREPLEIAHTIVDVVAEQVQPAGRGTYVFPFNRIKASLVSATRETRARLESVIDGVPSLRDRIIQRLEAAGCKGADVEVRTMYVSSAGADWTNSEFHLEFLRVTERADAPVAQEKRVGLELAVEHGSAEKSSYSYSARRVDIGRCAEVRDSRGRLLRTNHVAFTDCADEVNKSVSRRHAHLDYDPVACEYRVCDDRSAQGTGVVRAGRAITVPPGSRGIRLESGDVIVLGEARVRVTLHEL